MRPTSARKLRREVALRAGVRLPSVARDGRVLDEGVVEATTACAYCGAVIGVYWNGGQPTFMEVWRKDGELRERVAHLDHVIPERRNGPTSLDNTVIACQRCNIAKGDCAFGEPHFLDYLPGRRAEVSARGAAVSLLAQGGGA